jgi:very-short-patch-repair endonuclease
MNISYLRQYQVAQLPNKYYDFYFEYNGQKFLVELDGEQHFNCTSFYHDVFIHKQHMDRLKTRVAYDFGYKLIRIDHRELGNVRSHILQGIHYDKQIYLSTPKMYEYLNSIIPSEIIIQHSPSLASKYELI